MTIVAFQKEVSFKKLKTDSAQHSSNKCKNYLQETTHSTVTFSILFETSHFNSLLHAMSIFLVTLFLHLLLER